MGFIIIGFILVFCFMLFAIRKEMIAGDAICDAIIICLIGILAGLFIPTGGYNPPKEVQTIELQALPSQTSSDKKDENYVLVISNNEYLYSLPIESEHAENGSKAYTTKTVSEDSNIAGSTVIEVIEEENCQTPRLTEYLQKSKITFWSFGLLHRKTTYVFYVPEGTVTYGLTNGN